MIRRTAVRIYEVAKPIAIFFVVFNFIMRVFAFIVIILLLILSLAFDAKPIIEVLKF